MPPKALRQHSSSKPTILRTISEEADDAVLTAIDPNVLNSSTLEMIRANQTSLKGDRQVIEIIDTGLVIGHAAFAGSMDGVDVRMSQADVEALTSKLPHGKGGRYVSTKIPFVYDYADEDDNPNPGYIFNSLHGTHVAGIAAANAPSCGRCTGTLRSSLQKWPEMAAAFRTGQCWMRSMTPHPQTGHHQPVSCARRWHEQRGRQRLRWCAQSPDR